MSLKQQITRESLRLFSLNGFLSTGIIEIFAVADTSKGGFYNHFSSKEQLFYAVLAESQSLWRERVLYGLREIDSPTDKIVAILINYKDRYLLDTENFPGGCIFITFSVELHDALPHLMEEVNKGFIGFKALLTRLLEEAKTDNEIYLDTDSKAVAQTLFAGMLGASVLYGVEKDDLVLDRAINSLIDYVQQLKYAHFQEQNV
jgi:AcrR family transcriptional regulator